MTVFVVEDDKNIRELVVYTLQAAGFEAAGFEAAGPFYTALAGGRLPDVVLLDIMLPGQDGLAILRRLRGGAATSQLPIMMLTAKGEEHDRVLGLDAGADDYIAKPFGMMELVSRVKALMRRIAPEKEQLVELKVGGVRILPQKREVTANGKPVTLTMKEFDLLETLLRSPGIVHSRDVLMEQVWGYDYGGETRTVDVHIRSLRQKLGSCADVVETVRGVGYKAVESE